MPDSDFAKRAWVKRRIKGRAAPCWMAKGDQRMKKGARQTLQDMIRWALAGESCYGIAARLNKEGYRTMGRTIVRY